VLPGKVLTNPLKGRRCRKREKGEGSSRPTIGWSGGTAEETGERGSTQQEGSFSTPLPGEKLSRGKESTFLLVFLVRRKKIKAEEA